MQAFELPIMAAFPNSHWHMTSMNTLFPVAATATMNAHAILEVSGADAAAFLQGQLSNDIDALATGLAQLSGYHSPKGRMLAFLRVLHAPSSGREPSFLLVLDEAIAEAVTQRLRMFVLRSQVRIARRDDLAARVLLGAGIPALLSRNHLPSPAPGSGVIVNECVFFALPSSPVPRIEVFGPADAMPALTVEAADPDALARWDILCKLPRILPEIQDAHVAQHLGLDELEGINFRKGCYTGQEIIARMKYLGRVKKRPAIFVANGASPGDVIRDENGQAAGEVVNVASQGNEVLMLAVVNLDSEKKTLAVDGNILQRVPV